MKITRETDNLFRLTALWIINCFLVREADGLTLVDTNVRGSAPFILQAAAGLGAPIRRIVITHAHFDHVGSLDRLAGTLPEVELFVGVRESRLLSGDHSLERGEHGKPLLGFQRVHARPTQLLQDGDEVGSLRTLSTAGHTPGHLSFLDLRDGSLIAGDAFVTQPMVVAAGVFHLLFPLPALFSWNGELCARSAEKLCALNPSRLAVGHGPTLTNPHECMNRALEEARRQHPAAKSNTP